MNASRAELDSTIVNIELTLASIIQGVALFFLTDNARAILADHDWSALLYIVAGLAIIFIFWSRSIIHTLTLIRWPLEFGHNFFYLACALGESILFTRLAQTSAWFKLSSGYAVLVWLLFIYDLRLVRAREREATSPEEHRLYAVAKRDQLLNIYLLAPLLVIFNVGCCALLISRPLIFLGNEGRVLLVSAQILSFLIYLSYTIRFWRKLSPLILAARSG